MKITVLTENTTGNENLTAEHGLSLFIETEKHKILFDMGQTDAFYNNAEKLGADLSKADFAVLSHGHYDHGGGIAKFLEINKTAKIFVSRLAFGEHYNASEKYIGLDKRLADEKRLIFVDDFYEITCGISLHSCNEKDRKFLTEPYGLGIERGGEICPDDFLHEQYLLIDENGKKVLFSGCSHKGVLNIEEWFAPDVFIGGFHLSKLDTHGEGALKLNETAESLMVNDTKYYTAHCTGVEQYRYLKEIMGDRLGYLSTGSVLEF